MADSIALSQEELDRVLCNVRSDNSERENKPVSSGIALSQAELDRLFGNSSASTGSEKKPAPAEPQPRVADSLQSQSAPNVQAQAMQDDSTASGVQTGAVGQESALEADAAAARAAKIAERKARAAEMLARVNASSPKRISVIYGSTLRKGDEISALAAGDTIVLDRALTETAEIQVDGKPFAYGVLGNANGNAAIKITRLL